jgi:hypothetical protein
LRESERFRLAESGPTVLAEPVRVEPLHEEERRRVVHAPQADEYTASALSQEAALQSDGAFRFTSFTESCLASGEHDEISDQSQRIVVDQFAQGEEPVLTAARG